MTKMNQEELLKLTKEYVNADEKFSNTLSEVLGDRSFYQRTFTNSTKKIKIIAGK